MWQGFSETQDHFLIAGVDYGEVMAGANQYMLPVPGIDDLIELEELGDMELIKKTIVHKGQFWIWMRPDR